MHSPFRKSRAVPTETTSAEAAVPGSGPEELLPANWPNRQFSSLVTVSGLRWHIPTMGSGPVCLLLHGTGASTHSFRDFAPALARRFKVIAFDLPGHGFTQTPPAAGMTLPGMSASIGQLLAALDVQPALAAGHSAGAAVLARLALDERLAAPLIVSLNGALLPYPGYGRTLFPALARLMFLNPVVPRVFAWRAKDQSAVDAVIANIGSAIDPAGLGQYGQLFRNPDHIAATLRMMANWDLDGLERDLPRLKTHLVLVATAGDIAIPAGARLRGARSRTGIKGRLSSAAGPSCP